jgi:DNA-binding transcriptional regulator YdaS (Cro superfamily)
MEPNTCAFAEACEIVGSQAVMARLLDLSPAMVNQIFKGTRPVPMAKCATVERETKGRVTADRLWPSYAWVRTTDPTWPHPLGKPMLDFSAALPAAEPARAEG